MEVIQWYTSGATKPGVPLNRDKATKHCLFRLDVLDKEFLTPDTIKWILNEDAKHCAEYGGHVSNNHLTLRVSEDDTDEYRMKCLEKFALLIGLLEPGKEIGDWIRENF